jgi:hypothetical protein
MARREVLALHAFFADWFRDNGGVVDFAVCERSLARDFSMTAPDGSVLDRTAVMERIQQAHGSRAAGFAIVVLDPRTLWQGRNAVLVGYIERHDGDGPTTRRRSSGLLTREPAAPRGVVWRHLQETWMAEDKSV